MQNLIAFLFFIFVVLLVIKKIRNTSPSSKGREQYYPYHKKQYFMTAAEYTFFKVLQEAVQDKYFIVPQVTLSNLVDVNDGYKWNKSWRSKIDKKSVDFVLFNKAGYTPYLAIELDDSTHSRSDRMERDDFVQNTLQRAGIRLQRVKNAYKYNLEEVVSII
ncbi:MAG: DUF2726 domain-containing protein [Candidatus Pacebacteria bacterium]|nr:DUF2726 domain-containing protein [Candidatus Paceibacterota bacterium]